jgi:drug/metabolite transporter (DMT)-like permease
MSIVYAILTTLSIGTGEFFAGGVTERARSHEVTSTMFLSGVLLTGVIALFWHGDPTSADLAYGAVAGVVNGFGVLLLYWSYARASIRSSAPAAAVVMSSVPIGWDVLIGGTSPSALTSIGLVLGVIAIGLTSYERGDEPIAVTGLQVAILAGAVFGVLLVLLSYIGEDAGGSPLLAQRIVGFVVAVAVTRATGPRIFPKNRQDFRIGLLVGLLASAAIVLFVLALQGGDLAVVGVIGSQYAGVAVLLGVVVRGQRLAWWQGVGLAGASAAVALIALG